MFLFSIPIKGYYFSLIQFVNIDLLFIIDFSPLLIKTLIVVTCEYPPLCVTDFLMMTISFMYP